MISTKKATTLEHLFPILVVENNSIVTKEGDISVVFSVTLPEVYTLTSEEFVVMHETWVKALSVLPPYSVLHKQDWFTKETYEVDFEKEYTFLTEQYQRHFNERPYLHHRCYLYLTKSSKKKMSQQSIRSSLCKKGILPQEITDQRTIDKFFESVTQFVQIMNDSSLVHLTQLSEEEIVGTENTPGLLDHYFTLDFKEFNQLEDISIESGQMKIGNKFIGLHTLSTTDDLPLNVSTSQSHDRLSTDRSECNISYASQVGLHLSANHIYNQYIFIEDADEVKNKLEAKARQMNSLINYSRANAINLEWLTDYLNISETQGIPPVRAHFNVLTWSESDKELNYLRNDVGSAIAKMNCTPRFNTADVPVIFWGGIPGNAGDFPKEETFWTFPSQAVCFFAGETNYRSSLSPFGIKMSDRISGKPIHVDISDLPMKKGVTTNRNKFILGPSGSGKSYFTNHMVRQYYEQGTHVLIVDTGHSYEGLCTLINQKTKGEDGIYLTYKEDNPISFNPFYTEDYIYPTEKQESLSTLLITLWKKADEPIRKIEEVQIGQAVAMYIRKIQQDRTIFPCFNTFYDFLNEDFRKYLYEREIPISTEEFNLNNLLNTIEVYYEGRQYDFLLNNRDKVDLLHKAFVIFEIDAIKDHETLLPIVTLVIMEAFINKMRRLDGIRKMIIIEEAWKAIASPKMAHFIKYLYKTVRKHFGEAVVVTQDPDDILKSEVVREAIINNSDCKIMLDQRKYMFKFEEIQAALGLTEKEKNQILSINMDLDPNRLYKEVWIGLGGVQSAVYATETSYEEGLIYSTEQSEKLLLKEKLREYGDIRRAVKAVVREKQNKVSSNKK